MTLPNEVFSAFAITGLLLCLISCPWHLTPWNTGACLYVFWTSVGCLNSFINSVVWNHNVINKAPVWCDISSKLILGVSIGIPTASFCICRRIYIISSLKSFTISKSESRRTIIIDSIIGLGIPLLIMSLHYIVQGHRFDILEDVGCGPSIYYSWQGYLVISGPPIIIGVVSAVYAILNIRQFYTMRNHLKTERTETSIDTAMYVRFIGLSSIEVLCTVPLATFFLIYNIVVLGIRRPWISWTDTHYNFSRVVFVPASMWHGSKVEVSLELNRWINVICAFTFFSFFGYTEDTRRTYRRVFSALARRVGFQRASRPGSQLPPIHFNSPKNTSEGTLGSLKDWNVSFSSSGGDIGEAKDKTDVESTSSLVASPPIHAITTSHPLLRSTDIPIKPSGLRQSFTNVSHTIFPPENVHLNPRSAMLIINSLSTQESVVT